MEVVSDKWSFVVDLKEEFGGEESGPNPSEFTAAALASCEALTGVVWAARRHRIELRDIEAEVSWEYGEKPERISGKNRAIGGNENCCIRKSESVAQQKRARIKACIEVVLANCQ